MSVDVGSATGYLDLDISGFLAGLRTAQEEASKQTNSIADKVSNNFKSIGSNMTSVGKTLTKTATLPIVGAGTAVIKMSSDFESAMSKVKAISGTSGDEFDSLRDKAKELGKTTVFSATEVANGMTEMAKAGWNSQQIMVGMEGVLNAASASGENLASVSTIVADAVTGFGMKASDATRIADLLTQAANAGTIDIVDLGESFKYISPVAASMGLSIEDVTTALSAMSMAGIKGSQAGTSIRTVLARMSKPTGAVAAAMDKLGININNADGSFKSLDEIVAIMRDSFSGLTDEQKAYYATTLAGQEGMSGLLALLNLTKEEYDAIGKSMDNCAGVAKETSKVMLDNVQGQLKLLKSQLEGVAIQLGEILLPIMKRAVDAISDLVERFSKMSTEEQENVIKLALMAATIGPLLFIIGKLTSCVGTFIGSIIKAHAAIAAKTTATFIDTAATGAATTATSLLGVAMSALPIIGIIAGIGALIGIVYNFTKGQKDAAKETSKLTKETNALMEENKKLKEELKENAKARKENVKSAEVEGIEAENLWEKIKKLSKVEDKSNAQKKIMHSLVKKLNDLVPDLNLKYDEEKDKLNKSTKAIEKNIEARKKQLLAEAMQENAKDVISDLSKETFALEDNKKAYQKNIKKRDEWNAKADKYREQEKKMKDEVVKSTYAYADSYDDLDTASQRWIDDLLEEDEAYQRIVNKYNEAAKNGATYQNSANKLNATIDEQKKKIKSLDKQYKRYEEAASKLLNQVDAEDKLDKLTKKAKKAGVEIPKAISDGIKNGQYAVPKSVSGLQSLVKYDELVKKANEAGIKVPKSLSKGIQNGSVKPKKAVAEMNNLISFNEIVSKAGIDGKKITDSLADGIATGKYEIPKSVDELNSLIKYDKLSVKAKKAGVKIPKEITEGIQSGQYAVPKSVEKLEYLIQYDGLIKDAKKAGTEIPKSITNGIKSGKLSPSLAVTQMNRYIDFDKKVKEAGLSGKKIPKKIKEGILSGKLKPNEAIKQLNSEIKKELNKDNGEKAAGKKKSDNVASGINSGKDKVKNSAKDVGNEAKKSADSVKFKSVGENYTSGITSGVNKGKGGLLETIKGLGASMISAIKKILGIHSPSKVMKEQVGANIALGVIEGIKSKKANAKKSAEQLGKLYVTAAQNKLETLKGKNKLSLQEEIKYWQEIRKHTVAGTTAYTQANKKIKNVQKDYIKDAEDTLKKKKQTNKASLRDEVDYWKNIQKGLKKGTTAYKEATQNLKVAKKSLNDSLKKLNKEYVDDVAKVQKKLTEDVNNVMAEYDKAVNERAKSIASSTGLFDKFESTTEYTKESLTENLRSQVNGIKDWSAALDTLNKRGVDSELIKELQEMGPSALSNVQLLVSMSGQELDEYVSLWRQKNSAAVTQALTEVDKQEYLDQIKELINEANTELNTLEKEYKKNLKSFGVAAKDTSKKVGKQIVAGLKKGVKSDFPGFLEYVKDSLKKVTSTAKKALGIKSPSRVFQSIGNFMTAGLSKGFVNGMQGVQKDVKEEVEGLADVDATANVGIDSSFLRMIETLKATYSEMQIWFDSFDTRLLKTFDILQYNLRLLMQTLRMAINPSMSFNDEFGYVSRSGFGRNPNNPVVIDDSNNPNAVGDTFNFYSPKPIDEIEAARQMKKAKRDLAEGF